MYLTAYYSLQIFFLSLTVTFIYSRAIRKNTLNYILKTELVHLASFSDPMGKDNLEKLEWFFPKDRIVQYLKSFENTTANTKAPKVVKNLYSTLSHFINDNCLIVINNFEEVISIQQLSSL